MKNDTDYLDYVLPSHRLTGTRAKILEQLDEIILRLIGLRRLISQQGSASAAHTRTVRTLRLVVPVLIAALLIAAPAVANEQSSVPQGDPRTASPLAQPPETREWTYGAFLDVADLNALNHPVNKLFRSRGTAWHLDDLHLNMMGAYVKKKPTEQSRWGTELLVHSGKDDEIFGFSATAPNIKGSDWLKHLGLANVSYVAPAGKGLTLRGGIFGSLIGYDSLYAKDNFNYTRPWGADFTPYLMLGINASYPFSDKLTGTVYVVNGYWHLADANGIPSSGVQLAYKATPEVTVKQTMLLGPHQSNTAFQFWRFLSDTIVERRMERLVVAGEFHFATENVAPGGVGGNGRAWWVAAQAPIRWHVRGPWSVAVRPEVARDSSGRWTLAEQTVKALTTTLEYKARYKWTNTILRLEHRIDNSTGRQGGFFDDFETSPGTIALRPTQHLLIVAAIFTFDSPAQR